MRSHGSSPRYWRGYHRRYHSIRWGIKRCLRLGSPFCFPIAAYNITEEKFKRETLAVDYISCLLKGPNPSAAAEIKELFDEFEENKTPEAKFVKEIDAFECLVQEEEYEDRATKDHNFSEFYNLQSRISSKDLSHWTELLVEERNAITKKRSTDTVIVFVIGKHDPPPTVDL